MMAVLIDKACVNGASLPIGRKDDFCMMCMEVFIEKEVHGEKW